MTWTLTASQAHLLQIAKELEAIADAAHGDSFRYALEPAFREAARVLRRYYLPEDSPSSHAPVKSIVADSVIAPDIAPDDETARIQYEAYGSSGLAILYESRKYYDFKADRKSQVTQG